VENPDLKETHLWWL